MRCFPFHFPPTQQSHTFPQSKTQSNAFSSFLVHSPQILREKDMFHPKLPKTPPRKPKTSQDSRGRICLSHFPGPRAPSPASARWSASAPGRGAARGRLPASRSRAANNPVVALSPSRGQLLSTCPSTRSCAVSMWFFAGSPEKARPVLLGKPYRPGHACRRLPKWQLQALSTRTTTHPAN